jgi:hypothetical protein
MLSLHAVLIPKNKNKYKIHQTEVIDIRIIHNERISYMTDYVPYIYNNNYYYYYLLSVQKNQYYPK